MMVIKNTSGARFPIDGVWIEPNEQLSISHLTPDMLAAKDAGKLQIKDGDETLEERRKDIEAINAGIKGMGDV